MNKNKGIEEVTYNKDKDGYVSVTQTRVVKQAPQQQSSSTEFDSFLIKAKSGDQEATLYLLNYFSNRADHLNALAFYKMYNKVTPNFLERYYLTFTKVPLTKVSFNYLIDLTLKGHEKAVVHMAQIIEQDNLNLLTLSEKKNLFLKLYKTGIIYFSEQLGDILFIEKKYSEALVLYEKMLNINCLKNYHNIADIYYLYSAKKDYVKAFKYYSLCNSVNAYYRLATMYEKGLGIKKDMEKAYGLYMTCVENGMNEAKLKLLPALCDEDGEYYNPGLAFRIAKAAASFDMEANFYLGICYLKSMGTDCNERLAFNAFLRAAVTNKELHVRYLADCYYYGIGIDQNYVKAIESYIKLTKTDEVNEKLYDCYTSIDDQRGLFKFLQITLNNKSTNVEQLLKLAHFYLDGNVITRNEEMACKYLQIAANNDSEEALYLLACLYYQSSDKAKQLECIDWYEMLANNNHEEAIEFLFNYYKDKNEDKAYKYAKLLEDKNIEEVLIFLAKNSLNGDSINMEDAFKYNKFLADKGETDLYNLIGDFYYQGLVVDKNDEEAFSYYMLAANCNEVEAYFSLGYCYENGLFVDRDYKTAHKYYSDAEKKGSLKAKLALANLNDNAIDTDVDYKVSFEIYTQLANIDTYSVYKLGYCYENGLGCKKNIKKAISYYNQAFEQGELFVAITLASLYEEGKVVKKDLRAAFDNYMKVSSFNSVAQYKLAYFYQNALSMKKKDMDQAIKYYQMASENGCPNSKLILGNLHINGEYVEKDFTKAIEYFEESISCGNNDGYYQLANCYYKGLGCEQNYDKAYQLYLKSASNYDIWGYFGLANCYYEGNGIVQDYKEAFNLYKKVADEEISIAYVKLGICYETGNGVTQNHEEAIRYYNLALSDTPEAKFRLGKYYIEGTHIKKNVKLGSKLLDESAKSNIDAMFKLAEYYRSNGSNSSLVKACNLYKRAYENGSNEGAKEYALCLYFGRGIAKNEAAAAEIFSEERFDNDAEIRYYLGCYIKNNSNDISDVEQAIECLEFSASNLYEKAMYDLADMYYVGDFAPKDLKKSFLYNKLLEKNEDRIVLLRLAEFYNSGLYCERDVEKAIELYSKLVDKNDQESINALGEIYYNLGKYDKAISLFEKISNNNHHASFNLALCYLYGNGVTANTKFALKKIESLAKNNYPKALNFIGELYLNGEIYKQNITKAMKYFNNADELGDEKALLNLAQCYLSGVGVEENHKEAFNVYVKGTAKGNPSAMNKLGEMYENGDVIFQDLDKAFSYYTKAVELGNKPAITNLAKMYLNGVATKKDLDKAINYFKIADANGCLEASAQLAKCYYLGVGVVKDLGKTYELIQKTEQFSSSKNILGEFYENGFIVDENKHKAFKYYSDASYDDVDAQFNLAKCYELGVKSTNKKDIEPDFNLAKQYYTKAALSGHEQAKQSLAKIKVQPYNEM